MEGSSLRRRKVTVTRNSALGTSPTTSALGKRCFVLPASLVCFCPAFMMCCSSLFSILWVLLSVMWLSYSLLLAGSLQSAHRRRVPGGTQINEVVEHVKPEGRAQNNGEGSEQNAEHFQSSRAETVGHR